MAKLDWVNLRFQEQWSDTSQSDHPKDFQEIYKELALLLYKAYLRNLQKQQAKDAMVGV